MQRKTPKNSIVKRIEARACISSRFSRPSCVLVFRRTRTKAVRALCESYVQLYTFTLHVRIPRQHGMLCTKCRRCWLASGPAQWAKHASAQEGGKKDQDVGSTKGENPLARIQGIDSCLSTYTYSRFRSRAFSRASAFAPLTTDTSLPPLMRWNCGTLLT